MDSKLEAIENLQKVVLKELKEKPYYEEFEAWKNDYLNSNPELASQLTPLYNEILSLKKECWNGTFHRPWEPEFTMLRKTIKICERNNASFDFMAFRLLFANGAAIGSLEGEKILRYVQNVDVPIEQKISCFGVDVRSLYEEISEEENTVSRLYKEKFI